MSKKNLKVKQEVKQEIQQDVKQEIQQDVKQEIQQDVKQDKCSDKKIKNVKKKERYVIQILEDRF